MSQFYKSLIRAGFDNHHLLNITPKRVYFHNRKYFSSLPQKLLHSKTLERPFSYQLYCNIKFIHKNSIVNSKSHSEDAAIHDDLMEISRDVNTEPENWSHIHNTRLILHASLNNDPVISQLNKSSSIQDVFKTIKENSTILKHQHVSQAIVVLWDLQTAYSELYLKNLGKNDVDTSPESMLEDYVTALKSHQDFQNLLNLLESHCASFDTNQLSYCMLYLKKMGITFDNNVMNMLLEMCHDRIVNFENEWNLIALSRFTSAIDNKESLRFVYIAKDIFPTVLKSLESCNNSDDFKLITICLHNIHTFVNTSILNDYKNKAKFLVKSGIITEQNYSTILKIITFFNLPHWASFNTDDVRFFCQLIENSIKIMDASEIISLHKVFQVHLEPASTKAMIQDRVVQLLEQLKSDDKIATYIKLPELFNCQVASFQPQDRLKFEKLLTDLIEHSYPSTLLSIYKILRYLKISNIKTCDSFWNRILESTDIKNDDTALLRICHIYMYFNNNLNTTYRNSHFERTLCKAVVSRIESGIVSHIPWKFSRCLAFLVAFAFNKSTDLLNISLINRLVDTLDSFSDQLDMLDCLILTKGIQISLNIKKKTLPNVGFVYLRLHSILDKCAMRHFKSLDLSMNNLNTIFKSLIYRRAQCDTEVYNTLLEQYIQRTDDLSSRYIRDISFGMSTINVVIPSMLDQSIDYIAKHGHLLLGETSIKVLNLCYSTGYTPKNSHFFESVLNVLERDKELITGLSLLKSSISLCFFNYLSESLMKYVFSLHFMERLDSEVASCYSKMTYPARIRRELMHLNRTICIDHPQCEIPWFHQKYIEESIAFTQKKMSFFQEDVFSALSGATGKKDAINYFYFSPYGYKVDFMLKFDRNKNLLPINASEEITRKKVAILLLDSRSFTKIFNGLTSENVKQNSYNSLQRNGSVQEKRRHLEQLGYKVVEISTYLWNSMYMNEPKAKRDFINKNILN